MPHESRPCGAEAERRELPRLASVQWVTRHLGRALTTAEQAVVSILREATGLGPYDLPLWEERLVPDPRDPDVARYAIGYDWSAIRLPQLLTRARDLGARIDVHPGGGDVILVVVLLTPAGLERWWPQR